MELQESDFWDFSSDTDPKESIKCNKTSRLNPPLTFPHSFSKSVSVAPISIANNQAQTQGMSQSFKNSSSRLRPPVIRYQAAHSSNGNYVSLKARRINKSSSSNNYNDIIGAMAMITVTQPPRSLAGPSYNRKSFAARERERERIKRIRKHGALRTATIPQLSMTFDSTSQLNKADANQEEDIYESKQTITESADSSNCYQDLGDMPRQSSEGDYSDIAHNSITTLFENVANQEQATETRSGSEKWKVWRSLKRKLTNYFTQACDS